MGKFSNKYLSVPFGKYKNQPVEVLAMDREYVDWCLSQQGIREKYPDFVNIIVNNFQDPSETPEHNKIQALFLDDNFVKEFLKSVGVDVYQNYAFYEQTRKSAELEVFNFNGLHLVNFEQRYSKYTFDVSIRLIENEIYRTKCKTREEVKKKLYNEKGIRFETLKRYPTIFKYNYLVEIKPVLSDDYPSILRKLPAGSILLIDEFKTNSITLDQLKQIFKTKNIEVILLKDILNVKYEVEQ